MHTWKQGNPHNQNPTNSPNRDSPKDYSATMMKKRIRLRRPPRSTSTSDEAGGIMLGFRPFVPPQSGSGMRTSRTAFFHRGRAGAHGRALAGIIKETPNTKAVEKAVAGYVCLVLNRVNRGCEPRAVPRGSQAEEKTRNERCGSGAGLLATVLGFSQLKKPLLTAGSCATFVEASFWHTRRH